MLLPAGEHAARERRVKFYYENIYGYALRHSEPGIDAISYLSVRLSQGTVNARASIRKARAENTSKMLDTRGKAGNITCISEVAWRDCCRRINLQRISLTPQMY